jgi:hypothetical protein
MSDAASLIFLFLNSFLAATLPHGDSMASAC